MEEEDSDVVYERSATLAYCMPRLGMSLALIFGVQFAVKVAVAVANHRVTQVRTLSPLASTRVHNTVAFVGAGIALIAVALANAGDAPAAELWLLLPVFLALALAAGGFYTSAGTVQPHQMAGIMSGMQVCHYCDKSNFIPLYSRAFFK
jgi:hypothetical protein